MEIELIPKSISPALPPFPDVRLAAWIAHSHSVPWKMIKMGYLDTDSSCHVSWQITFSSQGLLITYLVLISALKCCYKVPCRYGIHPNPMEPPYPSRWQSWDRRLGNTEHSGILAWVCLGSIFSSAEHLVIESDKYMEGTVIFFRCRWALAVWLQQIFQLLWAGWQWLILVFVQAAVYDGGVHRVINRIKSQAEESDYCKTHLFQVHQLFLLRDVLEIILHLEVV